MPTYAVFDGNEMSLIKAKSREVLFSETRLASGQPTELHELVP
jgi:hypothetical protein